MSLRINHNIAAINAHRNLVKNDERMGKTLERLSSGLKINRGADGPAALVISEQMRSQVAGLTQAIMNSESAVSMVQTTEAALNEVNSLLIGMRQLAIHSANEGVNDDIMLQANQAELSNAMQTIDRISKNTQFGTKSLLDGSFGISGTAAGEGLSFINAGTKTLSSPHSGYSVEVTQEATQAKITGAVALSQDLIDSEETFIIKEGSRNVQFTTSLGESLESVVNKINSKLRNADMSLDVFADENDQMTVVQKKYGSKHTFSVISSTDGVLSEKADTSTRVMNGQDIHGTISGEVTIGDGQFLTGDIGTNVEGLTVRYTGSSKTTQPGMDVGALGELDPALAAEDELDGVSPTGEPSAFDMAAEEDTEVGRVMVENHALIFQIGGNRGQNVKVLLPHTSTEKLGTKINNESGFKNIRDLDITSAQGAQDALLLVDQAINEISSLRAELGAIQKNTLESNISGLRVAKENLINAESVIRDADMAIEMSDFTRNQIMSQSATAMLAQANQAPNNVLTLLK
ncbi:MAG: flagellin [SAR324 cluster bacterium]|uniref:Flagellin n=1 Tax=SAR324 cluster bacterium TaxID=2024889 RepID=A0A2A4SM37_9DELT|nr:MAG: flagellin [SAR324 cluster bacterium]